MASIEYLVEVTGILPSVSPLQLIEYKIAYFSHVTLYNVILFMLCIFKLVCVCEEERCWGELHLNIQTRIPLAMNSFRRGITVVGLSFHPLMISLFIFKFKFS